MQRHRALYEEGMDYVVGEDVMQLKHKLCGGNMHYAMETCVM